MQSGRKNGFFLGNKRIILGESGVVSRGLVRPCFDNAKLQHSEAIWKLQDRGTFFVNPNEDVYAGEVIGENTRSNDIVINVCKTKHLTNVRASGSDEAIRLIPPVRFSLEEYMEYIRDDEYLEVTPKSLRLRKIILDELERKRASRRGEE